MASWYCDSCLVVLCGVQFVLFCVFTLLFPCWHFWPPAAFFFAWILNGEKKNHVQILTGLKTPVVSQPTWKGAIVPVLVDLCQSLKYLGSYMQEVHTMWLVEGNIDRLKTGKSYRWEPQASRFESHNRTPPGLYGDVLALSKDLGYRKNHSSREKVLLQAN